MYILEELNDNNNREVEEFTGPEQIPNKSINNICYADDLISMML